MGFLRPHFSRRRPASSLFWLALACAGLAGELCGQTDGSERWKLSTGVRNARIESSPVMDAEGTVYIGLAINTTPPGGQIFAIRRNGTEKWRSALLPDWVHSSPALSNDGAELYVGCFDGRVYALNTSNGALRWSRDTGPRNYIVSSPAVGADGTIYVGAGDWGDGPEFESGLFAFNRNGTLRWKKLTGQPETELHWVESSPAIGIDGTIYFGSLDEHLYAVTPTGTERWSFRADSPLWGSPAIGPDGTVYIGSHNGTLYAVSRDGVARWEFSTDGAIFGGVAIGADGGIFVGSAGASLYALEADRTLRWRKQLGQAMLSTPTVRADGSIIAGADDYRIRAFGAEDGEERWSVLASHFLRSSAAVGDGCIYVAALDGLIYALNSTAALSEQSTWPAFRGGIVAPGGVPHRGRARAPLDAARLVNLATRATVSPQTNLIAGFVVRGTTTEYYLIRAVGPTLQQFGVTSPLSNPTLTVRRQQNGEMVNGGFNDDWSDDGEGPRPSLAAARLGAFPLPPGSKDAVLVPSLEPAAYTATVGSTDGGAGVALVEAYDASLDEPGAQLVNLSTRGHVGAGNSIIPGLVVRGSGPLRLLVRAVGPGLAQFGVPSVLARPTLAVFSGQTMIRANSGWTTDGWRGDIAGAARLAGAFPLASGSLDSAALLTLNPGDYTIHVAGANGATGEVLVEVYVSP